MKKFISLLILILLLLIPGSVFASAIVDSADPMSMEAWKQYIGQFGFDDEGIYNTSESSMLEVLDDFHCEGLFEQLLAAWDIEGDTQIFGYRFTDSESAQTMLETVASIYEEKGRKEIDIIQKDHYSVVKFARESSSDWCLDLLQYDSDFVFIEICDENGEVILDDLLETVFSSIEKGEVTINHVTETNLETIAEIAEGTAANKFDPEEVIRLYNHNILNLMDILIDGDYDRDHYYNGFSLTKNSLKTSSNVEVYSTSGNQCLMLFPKDGQSLTCITDLTVAEANLPEIILVYTFLFDYQVDFSMFEWINGGYEDISVYVGSDFVASHAYASNDTSVLTVIKK